MRGEKKILREEKYGFIDSVYSRSFLPEETKKCNAERLEEDGKSDLALRSDERFSLETYDAT